MNIEVRSESFHVYEGKHQCSSARTLSDQHIASVSANNEAIHALTNLVHAVLDTFD